MNKFMTRLTFKRKQNNCVPENGFELVEVVVAGIIILLVLLSTAYGLSGAFRSSAGVENHNKAVQLAANIVAIAKQSSYRSLWVTTERTTGVNAAIFDQVGS